MIIEITCKDTQVADLAREEITNNIQAEYPDLDADDLRDKINEHMAVFKSFLVFDELFTIQLDTEKKTCVVKQA